MKCFLASGCRKNQTSDVLTVKITESGNRKLINQLENELG
jgi:hypothetical protein